MNDEVLPTFYASQWKYAKNQKDFVKKFHSEGRRQYEIRKNVLRVSQRLENVCSEKNPASAGKFLSNSRVEENSRGNTARCKQSSRRDCKGGCPAVYEIYK